MACSVKSDFEHYHYHIAASIHSRCSDPNDCTGRTITVTAAVHDSTRVLTFNRRPQGKALTQGCSSPTWSEQTLHRPSRMAVIDTPHTTTTFTTWPKATVSYISCDNNYDHAKVSAGLLPDSNMIWRTSSMTKLSECVY